jgi:hypothetical protein
MRLAGSSTDGNVLNSPGGRGTIPAEMKQTADEVLDVPPAMTNEESRVGVYSNGNKPTKASEIAADTLPASKPMKKNVVWACRLFAKFEDVS